MTTLSFQSCRPCQIHYQLHLLVPTPRHLRTLTLMIFPGDLKSWKRKHRSPSPGTIQALGVETEKFLLVTKNLHEILFHLLTITEHTPPRGSLPALPNCGAFQFLTAPKRWTTGDTVSPEQPTLEAVLVCFLSVWTQALLACPTIPSGERRKRLAGRADTDGWAVGESTYEVSQPCAAEVLDLVQVDLW